MKTIKNLTLSLIVVLVTGFSLVNAQEKVTEKENPFSVGVDVVSSYVWRGTKFSGPAVQPYLEFGKGGFAIGSWGSFGFGDEVSEADLYVSYAFDFGLSLGVTDYYYQGTPYFRYSTDSASHAFEVNAGYELADFTISANYIVNDASQGGPANAGSDLYFELGYSFGDFDVFVGAGDGWHTSDGEFNVCNVGILVTKEIKSIPVFGSVILNPEKESFDIVVGFSL